MIHSLIELIVILAVTGIITLFFIRKEHAWLLRAGLILLGVFLFEVLSQPMWRNPGWSGWTYLYGNVNWIVTLGWTLIFLFTLFVTSKIQPERTQFWSRIGILTIVTAPIEVFLYETGLRDYSSELAATFSGILIPWTSAPVEVFLAIPLIGILVIPFALHLEKLITGKPKKTVRAGKKRKKSR